MYISRTPLNVVRPEAIELVSSPYKMHAAVENAFPPGTVRDSSQGRILWRIDPVRDGGHAAWLYVVSPEKPDFTHIDEQAGWPISGKSESKDYSALLDMLKNGQRWAFRLKANPARKVFQDKGRRQRDGVVNTIQGHVTIAQQEEWLIQRSERHGFKILENEDGSKQLSLSQRAKSTFDRKGEHVTLVTAVYDGVLEITDAQLFRATLCSGIGRAKGFGCGLLTIAPLSRSPR